MTNPVSLRLRRVGFAYSDAAPLFEGVDFHLSPGFVGLVGPNGRGKSTLLRLLSGELLPSSGSLSFEPRTAVVAHCPQRVEELTAEVEAFAVAVDRTSSRLRAELGLAKASIERWSTLSPGERKRWQLGAALGGEPEVLLLDEPDNHLDRSARALLHGALRRFRGLCVIVSHDRELLDELTTSTLRLHRESVTLHVGSYSQARAEWLAAERARRAEREAQKGEQARLERNLHELRQKRAAATASRSSAKRMKDENDSDARGALAKGRAESAEKRIGRSVGVARRRAARAAGELLPLAADREVGRSVFVGYVRAPGEVLGHLDADVLRAGDREVLRDVRITLYRGARVRVEGDNGSGKSTLLGALVAAARIPAERMLYLKQELDSCESARLLEEVRKLPPAERGRVLSLVAALGVDPDPLLASSAPSPGEARKLSLAFGLARHAWAVILDEPENHLDLPSVERLETALEGYPGALVLVSHDPTFAARCTNERWLVSGGRVSVTSG